MSEAAIRTLRSDEGIAQLARVFHALSDETRLRIVGRLLTGEQCVCNLTEALGAAQSRLSFHMKILREAGLVTHRRQGRWLHYSVVPDTIHQIERFLSNVAERALKCCN